MEEFEQVDGNSVQEGNIVVPQRVIDVIESAPNGVEILSTCVDLAVFLAEKNIAYGDSVLNPIRVLSKADDLEQIRVRIDDKLSRLIRGQAYGTENHLRDLLGYLVLYFMLLGRSTNDNGGEIPTE